MASTTDKGRRGEQLAAAHLEQIGYRILQRNFKCRHGEVDIIAVREDSVVFVEVKAWERMPATELHRAVDRRRRNRLRLCAETFLRRYPVLAVYRRRFELVFLTGGGRIARHVSVAVGE